MILLLLLFTVFSVKLAVAGTVSWNAAVDGSWSDGTKWSGGVAPSSVDDVLINVDGSYTVTLDTDATANSLDLGGSNGAQTLSNGNYSLTLNNTVAVQTLGVMSLSGGSLTVSSATTLAGQLLISGTGIASFNGAIGGSGGLISVSEGTVNLNTTEPSTITTVTLSGGVLNNDGPLNITTFNANLVGDGGATLGGAGAVNLTGVCGVTILTAAPGTLTLDNGKILTNFGSFTQRGTSWSNWWTGEYGNGPALVSLANGSSIINAGTWVLSGGDIVPGSGANGGFINNGILTTVSPATINRNVGYVNVDFTNSGTVNGTVSTLSLSGAGSYTHSGTFTVAEGATITIGSGSHSLTGLNPVSGSGTINFIGSSTITNPVVMTGGIISLAGTTNTIGDVTTTGTLSFAGTSTNTISGQLIVGTLSNNGSAVTTFGDNILVTNSINTLKVSGGTLNLINTIQANQVDTITQSGGTLNLNSNDASSLNRLSISGGTLNNIGVLNINSMTAKFPYNGGATLGGVGGVNLIDTSTISVDLGCYSWGCGYVASGMLTLDSGKVLTNKATGNFSVLGWANFGPATVALANGSSIVNEGTWTLGNGNLTLGPGTASATGFSNVGALVVGRTTTDWYGSYGNGGTVGVSLVNAGTVNTTVGTLVMSGTGTQVHSGVFNTLAEGTINFSAGDHALNGLASITGYGSVNFSGVGNTIISGSIDTGSLGLGTGTSNITGSLTTNSLSNNGITTINGVTRVNSILQRGSGLLSLTDSTATGVTSLDIGGGTVSIISSLNTLNSLTMSGGSFDINVPVTGLNAITISAGSISVSVPVSGLRAVNMSGGALSLGNSATTDLVTLNLDNGILTNSGVMNVGSLTSNFPYNGGATLGGTGAVNLTGMGSVNAGLGCYSWGCGYVASGVLTLDGGKVLTNKAAGNFSVLGWANFGPATVALANGSSIINEGTWTLGNGNLILGGGAVAATGFSNFGILQSSQTATDWSGGHGFGGTVNVSLVNTGIVNGGLGTLNLAGSLTQSGAVVVASGATISRPTGFTSTGSLSGSGTIVVGTGGSKLVNHGSMIPGGTGLAGTLTITGDLQLSTGSNLIVDIGGTTDPDQFDKLAVSGTVTLGGTASVNLINTYTADYTPVVKDIFKVMTFSKKNGTFGAITIPPMPSKKWGIVYNPNNVTLLVYPGNGESNVALYQSTGALRFSPSALYNGSKTTMSAVATSGLAVIFSSLTPSVCTVNGSIVSAIAEGICTIAADQPGNADYLPAARVTRDVNTTFTRQTITWVNQDGGNWSDGNNWSGGVAPTAGDTALITADGTYTVTLDSNVTVDKLTIGGTSGAQTLAAVGNTLNINSATTVSAKGNMDLGGGVLNMSGPTTLGGIIRNGTIASDSIINSNDGMLDGVTLGGASMTIAGILHVANGITLANGLTVDSGSTTWYFSGTPKLVTTPGAATIISTGGTVYPSEDAGNAIFTVDPGITWYFNNAPKSACTPVVAPSSAVQNITSEGAAMPTASQAPGDSSCSPIKILPSYTYCPSCSGCWYCFNVTFDTTINNDGTVIYPAGCSNCNDPNMVNSGTCSSVPDSGGPTASEPPKKNPDLPAGAGRQCVPKPSQGDPVDLSTGFYFDSMQLISIAAAGAPLEMTLNYSSGNPTDSSTGFGWGHSYQYILTDNTTSVQITWPDRHISSFALNSAGTYINSSAGSSDVLTKNGDGSYTFNDLRQKTYIFNSAGKLVSITDRLGFTRSFTYVGGNLDKVTDTLTGRFLQFSYDGLNRVTSVSGSATGTVVLAYSTAGDLASVTDPLGNATTFTYDSNHRLLTKVNALNVTVVSNTYDPDTCKIISQNDGSVATPLELFSYGTDGSTGSPFTIYTNRSGNSIRYDFDTNLNVISTSDPLGNTIARAYDAATKTQTVQTDELKNQTNFTYDSSGYILSRIDSYGNVASYSYDADHNIITSTDEDGKTTSMTYGPNHKLLIKTDPLGIVTSYTYTDLGQLESTTTPNGGVTSYVYDAIGQISTIYNPVGITTSYTYDPAGRVLTTIDGAGKIWKNSYDLMGHLLSTTDPLGHKSSYNYDALNHLSSTTTPNGGITTNSYDTHNNLISRTNPLGAVTSYAYDLNDRLISTADPLGNITTLTRDSKGQVASIADPLGNSTAIAHDAAGNIISQTDALNNITTLAYDKLHRLSSISDPLNKSTTSNYDAVSRLASKADAKGSVTGFAYDALNRLTQTTDAKGSKAGQTFDANGNRLSFTDTNGNPTSFTYDEANRVSSIKTADGAITSYTYNSRNLVATATNGRGQSASYTYDNAGRLHTITDPVGKITYSYDANGNILTIAEPAGTVSYSYDLANRITSHTDVFGNQITYGYDAASNLNTLTYPGNLTVTYSYDAANRMTQVKDWSNRITSYTYNARGEIITTTRANGTSGAYSYNAKGQLTSLAESFLTAINNYSIALSYDANGNITSETNIPAKARTAPTPGTMTYTADNRLATLNGHPIIFDTDGNMTSGVLNGVPATFTFDARSRLTSIGTSSYQYNAQNSRAAATNSGITTRYVIDPNAKLPRVLMETTSTGTPIAYYVYGAGLISRESQTGNYSTYHYDLRGSTIKLADNTGTVTDSYSYGAYGELVSSTGDTPNPFRYNGRDGVMTEPNGLYYMRARFYSPEARRFINRDTLLGNIDEAITLNRFAFVGGNPVGLVDPSGMAPNQTISTGLEGGGGGDAPEGFEWVVETGLLPVCDPRCKGMRINNNGQCLYKGRSLVPKTDPGIIDRLKRLLRDRVDRDGDGNLQPFERLPNGGSGIRG